MDLIWKNKPVKHMKKKELMSVIQEMYDVIVKAALVNKAAAERFRAMKDEKPLIQAVN